MLKFPVCTADSGNMNGIRRGVAGVAGSSVSGLDTVPVLTDVLGVELSKDPGSVAGLRIVDTGDRRAGAGS